MQLTINGQNRTIETVGTIAELLRQLQLEKDRVVVELNCEILATDKHSETILKDGDTLELIQFVGGG